MIIFDGLTLHRPLFYGPSVTVANPLPNPLPIAQQIQVDGPTLGQTCEPLSHEGRYIRRHEQT